MNKREKPVIRRGAKSRLWIIPPLLLALVALTQTFIVKHFHLNKWKGGGFAMFSTVDHYSNRFLRAYVETETGEVPAFLSDWRTSRLRIICMPNLSLLKEEAKRLDHKRWIRVDPETGGLERISGYPPSTALDAILRTYGNDGENGPGVGKTYPAFLVPAESMRENPGLVVETGDSRIEAYRLEYRGNGRIAGRVISTSEQP